MEKPKLNVWQPINVLRHRIFSHKISFTDEGLIISLKDGYDTKVEIVYSGTSEIIGDYVWNFSYANDIVQSYFLGDLEVEGQEQIDPSIGSENTFFKMTNSPAIENRIPEAFLDDLIKLEHHIYPLSDGFFEVISDYEPEFRYTKAEGCG